MYAGACVSSGGQTCNLVIGTTYAPSAACVQACLGAAPSLNLVPTCCTTVAGSPTSPCSCCSPLSTC